MKSTLKEKVLKALRESETFVSGQWLSEQEQVSRTAVWKMIKQLQAEGYDIESVSNRGYKLVESPDRISAEEIASRLHNPVMGREIYYYEKTSSTNNQAKKIAEEGAKHGAVVVAGMQTAGKGRRGNSWSSPPGHAIYITIVLRPDIAPQSASMLTLVAALAVQEGVESATSVCPMIKWPNDIIFNGKKITGILTEMTTEMQYINYAVVGIGININAEEMPPEIQEKATSLCIETGEKFNRGMITASVLDSFYRMYELFMETQDMTRLQGRYNQYLANFGREVRVLEPEQEYTGICHGIDQKGALLVTVGDERREVIAGEVSVRGVYGYGE